MAPIATSALADRIRIEDEVWDEAFATRVRSRRAVKRESLRAEHWMDSHEADLTVLTERPSPPRPVAAPEPPSEVSPLADGSARRVVRIQGRGAERNLPVTPRRAPAASVGFQPDRLARWAVLLGFLLVLVAILSSHF